MLTLAKQMPAYLLMVFLCTQLSPAQAAEAGSPSPAQPETAAKAESASPSVSPPVAAATVQPPSQIVLSRDTAVAMAVYRNVDLRIEAFNVKMAETDVAKSKGLYNPVLNATGTGGVTAVPGDAFFSAKTANASIGLTQNLPIGGNISATTQSGYFSVDVTGTETKDWRSTAGLAVTLPLLKNAGQEFVELNITMAANTQQDSLERFRASTSETVSNVIIAYNRLYVLKQIQETRVAALTSAQRLLDEIKKKTAPGAAQGMELANAEFAISQRRKDLVEASRSTSDQEAVLRYQIGLDIPIRIIPSDPPSRIEPQETDEQAIKSALESRNDLKQLQLSLKTAQLHERVARRQLWPELSVNASGGLTGTGFNFDESYRQIGNNPGTYWTVGMQLSVPLGNTTAANEHRRNKLRTEQAQEQIRSLSWKIRNDVESDMRALISARLQIVLSDKSRQLAEQRLEEYRKSTTLGSSTVQDLLNAENDWNNAVNTHLESAESFSNGVIKLWKDAGVLLDRQGIHIDTSHPGKLAESNVQPPAAAVATGVPATAATSSGATPEQIPITSPDKTATDAATQKPATARSIKTAPAASVPVPAAPAATILRYTLTIGEYDAESEMTEVIQKINRAGLVPSVKRVSKTETMIRLHIGDYPDQKSAQREIGRLRNLKVDGFVIHVGPGRFSVFAGSYRGQQQAAIEQSRLADLGIKSVLTEAAIPHTTSQVTAGNYATLDAAVNSAAQLEMQGLKSTITKYDNNN